MASIGRLPYIRPCYSLLASIFPKFFSLSYYYISLVLLHRSPAAFPTVMHYPPAGCTITFLLVNCHMYTLFPCRQHHHVFPKHNTTFGTSQNFIRNTIGSLVAPLCVASWSVTRVPVLTCSFFRFAHIVFSCTCDKSCRFSLFDYRQDAHISKHL